MDNFPLNFQSRYESKQILAMQGESLVMSIKLEQVLEASGRTLKGGSISQVLGRKTELRYFNRENLMWKTSHKSDGRAEKAIRG